MPSVTELLKKANKYNLVPGMRFTLHEEGALSLSKFNQVGSRRPYVYKSGEVLVYPGNLMQNVHGKVFMGLESNTKKGGMVPLDQDLFSEMQ